MNLKYQEQSHIVVSAGQHHSRVTEQLPDKITHNEGEITCFPICYPSFWLNAAVTGV